jgi:hypothetical protein
MTVGPINKVHFQGIGEYSPETGANEKDFSNAGSSATSVSHSTPHKALSQDVIYDSFIEILPQTVEEFESKSSLWSKIFSWWYQPDVKTQSPAYTASEVDLLEVDEVEPISPVPVIDEPDQLPADLEAAKLPPALRKTKYNEKKLAERELLDALSLMSDRTIEQIMYIILQVQIELEKDNANIAEGSFTKYQDFKKLQEKSLQDIQEVLRRDEKVAGKLKTAQNIAIAASFICGLAAAAVSFGVVPAAGGLLIGAVNILGSLGPVIATGVIAGMTKLSNLYFKKRLNEDNAQHVQFKYQDQYCDDRLEDSRNQLMAIAESDNVFKEQLIHLFKRFQKMCQLILER